MAQSSAGVPGAQAWAGVGWGQDSSGRGLLVEHHADDEPSLRGLIDASLDGLCRNRGISLPERGIEVAGVECAGEPACALVVAVFESAAWNSAAVRPDSAAARPNSAAARLAGRAAARSALRLAVRRRAS
jgi:arginine decarboxylase